jgi:uncharacterized protein (TIGR00730 family)
MFMRHICVFAGSSPGRDPRHQETARALGQELVKRGLGLVYGGARGGLMGILAETVLAQEGEVIGVLPRELFQREVPHHRLTTLYEVGSLHERVRLMADLADGCIALPGGFGTLNELFEMTTWAQLGLHTKPIGLLNVAAYFDPLLALVTHATQEGFLHPFHAQILLCKETPNELLESFATWATTRSALTVDSIPTGTSER